MEKMTATVGDIIAALSKYPADTPVFGYSYTDEGDALIAIAEYIDGPQLVEDEDWETGEPYSYYCAPYYCKGDSYVEEHWRKNGEGPVIYLRESGWSEESNENKIVLN